MGGQEGKDVESEKNTGWWGEELEGQSPAALNGKTTNKTVDRPK